MVKKIISMLVKGGDMKPGPALGTTLGPLGVNMGQVVSKVNQATASRKGIRVPVNLVIDLSTKAVEVEVKEPPVSQLIKAELKYEKGSATPGQAAVGDLTTEQITKIAKEKLGKTMSKELKTVLLEVAGSCLSNGVTINGKSAREFIQEIKEGKIAV